MTISAAILAYACLIVLRAEWSASSTIEVDEVSRVIANPQQAIATFDHVALFRRRRCHGRRSIPQRGLARPSAAGTR